MESSGSDSAETYHSFEDLTPSFDYGYFRVALSPSNSPRSRQEFFKYLPLEILVRIFLEISPRYAILFFSLSKSPPLDEILIDPFWRELYRNISFPLYGHRYSYIKYPNKNYSELAEKVVGHVGKSEWDDERRIVQIGIERVIAVTNPKYIFRAISLKVINHLVKSHLINLVNSSDQVAIESLATVKEVFKKRKKRVDKRLLFANLSGMEKDKTPSVMEQIENKCKIKSATIE